MWDELSVEREVPDDELATAVARALGVDRERVRVGEIDVRDGSICIERRATPGEFALRVGLYGVAEHTDHISFYRAFAAALATKLLVDDGEVNPHTAMLVTPAGDTVRVNVDPDTLAITGLHHVAYAEDEVPQVLQPADRTFRHTRGDALAHVVDDVMRDVLVPAPADADAFAAAYEPRVQDAHHALVELLRELVHRPATPADARVLRDSLARLRRAFPHGERGHFIDDAMQCAEAVLARPWDPNEPGDL